MVVRLESSLIPPSYVFPQIPLVFRSFPRGGQFICLRAHGAAGLCLSREGRLGCNCSLSWWTHTCHSSRTRWACLPLTPTQNMAVSQGNDLHPGPLEAWVMLSSAQAEASLPQDCWDLQGCAARAILQGLPHLNQFPISSLHQYQHKITADKTCGQRDDKQVMTTAGKSRIIMRVFYTAALLQAWRQHIQSEHSILKSAHPKELGLLWSQNPAGASIVVLGQKGHCNSWE